MGAQGQKKAFQARRRIKQFAMSVVFVIVLVGGWFVPVLGYFIPLCMVLGVGIAFFKGRKWCDWYCPRGSFFDAIAKRISPQKKIPDFFKRWPVRVGMLVFLMAVLGTQMVRLWPDFIAIGGFFVMLLTVTTTVGLILALVLHQRVWCYVCPIGTMQNIVGKNRYPLSIDPAGCTGCTLCARVCPVQVTPHAYKADTVARVDNADCLKCGTCAASCPKNALAFR